MCPMCPHRPHTSLTVLANLVCRTSSLHQQRVTGTRSYLEVSLAVTNGSDVVATCPASVTVCSCWTAVKESKVLSSTCGSRTPSKATHVPVFVRLEGATWCCEDLPFCSQWHRMTRRQVRTKIHGVTSRKTALVLIIFWVGWMAA
jgi:hypothetical protein